MVTVKNNDNKQSCFFHPSTTFSLRTEDEVFRNLTHLGKNWSILLRVGFWGPRYGVILRLQATRSVLIMEPWIEWSHRLVLKPCLPWSLKGPRAGAGGRPTRHDAGEPGPSR